MLIGKDLAEDDKNTWEKGARCVREEETTEDEVERIGEWINLRRKYICYH